MSELTLTQRIDRAEGAIACEKVMSKHCFYHAAGIHREEYYEMWSSRQDITWTHGFGQMGDRDQYYNNYVLNQERDTFQGYMNLWEAYPEVREFFGTTRHMMEYRALNEEAMHLITTPIVEVAEDGQSARCLFYTPGLIFSTLNPQQEREGQWMSERYGADFVRENDEWLYLNLRICPDIIAPMDIFPWAGDGAFVMGPPPGAGGGEGEDAPPPPTAGGGMMLKIPGPLYNTYTPDRVPPDAPEIPVPYKTLSDLKLYSDVKTLED